jgi:hypothetical protein
MPDLMIKLSDKVARDLAAKGDRVPAALARTLSDFKARLGAPTGTVGESRQYFRVDNVVPEKLEALRSALESLGDVEAAYIKPDDAAP